MGPRTWQGLALRGVDLVSTTRSQPSAEPQSPLIKSSRAWRTHVHGDAAGRPTLLCRDQPTGGLAGRLRKRPPQPPRHTLRPRSPGPRQSQDSPIPSPGLGKAWAPLSPSGAQRPLLGQGRFRSLGWAGSPSLVWTEVQSLSSCHWTTHPSPHLSRKASGTRSGRKSLQGLIVWVLATSHPGSNPSPLPSLSMGLKNGLMIICQLEPQTSLRGAGHGGSRVGGCC